MSPHEQYNHAPTKVLDDKAEHVRAAGAYPQPNQYWHKSVCSLLSQVSSPVILEGFEDLQLPSTHRPVMSETHIDMSHISPMETPIYNTYNCRDSALSSTANVLSILTFAYILVAGTLYHVAALYRVKGDSDWAAVQAQATRLRDFAWSIERRDAISTEFFKRLDDLDKEIARKLPGNVATGKWHLVWRQARSTWDRAEIEEKLYSLAQMRYV
jgi:hypothetical protein